MKDETKEILDYLKETDDKDIYGYVKDKILAYEESVKLLDYITNLQTIEQQYSAILSENAELQGKITNLQEEYEKEHYLVDKLTRQLNDEYKNTEYQCKQKEDCKSRNEKAIEYIKEHYYEMIFDGDFVVKSDNLLNILNGGDE